MAESFFKLINQANSSKVVAKLDPKHRALSFLVKPIKSPSMHILVFAADICQPGATFPGPQLGNFERGAQVIQ